MRGKQQLSNPFQDIESGLNVLAVVDFLLYDIHLYLCNCSLMLFYFRVIRSANNELK